MGLVTTLATLYGAHQGYFTPTSRSTLIVTSAVALVCLGMTIACWRLKTQIQREHEENQKRQDEEKGKDDDSRDGKEEKDSGSEPEPEVVV